MEAGTPKGTRDFMPEQMIARKKVISTVEQVFNRFGFYPIETPAFEYTDTLTAKCGDEVSKQVFKLEGTKFGLRFDLTVPLSRVVASNTALTKPFKRYCIARVWRYEEPQKGRFREFWQADVDVVGSSSMRADAECLSTAASALKELGFNGFEVRVNNRKILDAVVTQAGVPKEKEFDVFRSLDKLEKREEEGVKQELKDRGIPDDIITKLMDFIKITGSNEEKLELLEGMVGSTEAGRAGIDELKQLIDFFSKYEISGDCEIVIDFSLVRGLDYYTGPIFEIKIPGGNIGSVAGGGRFDKLIELYDAPATPATGISLGLERVIAVMQDREMVETAKTVSKVYVAPVKPEFYDYALKVVDFFRKSGVAAETDLMERSLRKQLDYANSMGIPFVAVVGAKEQKEEGVMLRDFESGEERLVSLEEALAKLSS